MNLIFVPIRMNGSLLKDGSRSRYGTDSCPNGDLAWRSVQVRRRQAMSRLEQYRKGGLG